MIRRPPRSTRTDTLFPYTTLFRSLHPQPEAPAGFGSARQPHAMGLLDQQSGNRASGDLCDGRTRLAAQLAEHERLWLARLYVGQCGGREILGQISFPYRSEERRVGKECVSKCISRLLPDN